MAASTSTALAPVSFQTHPDRYRHWRLRFEGDLARLSMAVDLNGGLRDDYELKLNSYDLGVDIQLADALLRFLAALNGTASGGGYELALACDRILLVDDRNSAVSFPEVPLLGVLPGTGGLTRITDKRKLRRDRCDVFATLAEGIKGKRAVEWGLV